MKTIARIYLTEGLFDEHCARMMKSGWKLVELRRYIGDIKVPGNILTRILCRLLNWSITQTHGMYAIYIHNQTDAYIPLTMEEQMDLEDAQSEELKDAYRKFHDIR